MHTIPLIQVARNIADAYIDANHPNHELDRETETLLSDYPEFNFSYLNDDTGEWVTISVCFLYPNNEITVSGYIHYPTYILIFRPIIKKWGPRIAPFDYTLKLTDHTEMVDWVCYNDEEDEEDTEEDANA